MNRTIAKAHRQIQNYANEIDNSKKGTSNNKKPTEGAELKIICVYDTHGRFRSNEWISANEQTTKEQIQHFRLVFLFIRIRYICSPFGLEC